MKKIFFLLAILISSVAGFSQFKNATLQAAGLTCAMCTKAINNSLAELSFIQSVKADIKNSQFLIQFKPGSTVDPDVLKKAVEDAGFSVAKLKLNASFDNVKVENDAHVNIDGKTYHFLGITPQVLNGEKAITLVDKNFVLPKEFKKYSSKTQMTCVETGKAGECCTKQGLKQNTRIYHVTI